MPLFIRSRQLDIPTPTISSVASDDEAVNFINDPEQIFDDLPMPFRLINKIVNKLVENSWEKVVQRQIERQLDAQRIKPPCYAPDRLYEEYEKVSCINTQLKDTIIIAHSTAITIKNLQTDENFDFEIGADLSIDKITCTKLDDESIILGLVDDMGFGKIVVFSQSQFHVVRTMNEQTEGDAKTNLQTFEISQDSEYCACALESEGQAWVDVYRIPKESWLKEIENAKKEFVKKSESNMEVAQTDSEEDQQELRSQITSQVLFPEVKFSAINLVLKVRSPGKMVNSNIRTAQDALNEVTMGEVIGQGTINCITEHSLKIQDTLFDHFHHEDLHYLEDDKKTSLPRPTFHFLKPSYMERATMQNKSADTYQNFAIWWTNNNNLSVYSLTKTGKDVEFKPDSVFPQISFISCTAVSPCGKKLSIALTNGTLTVWDREFGRSIFTSGISTSAIIHLSFLPNNYIPLASDVNSKLSFESRRNVYLLVGCDNGAVFNVHVTSSFTSPNNIKLIIEAPNQFGEKFQYLNMLKHVPEVLFKIQKDGDICLLDNRHGNILCKLSLEEEHICDIPSSSFVAFSSTDKVFLISTSSINPAQTLLTSFTISNMAAIENLEKLHSDSNMEQEEKSACFMDCVQELLTERISNQKQRTEHLVSRWRNLTKQFGFVLDLKETVALSQKSRGKSSPSSSRWSKTTSKLMAKKKSASPKVS